MNEIHQEMNMKIKYHPVESSKEEEIPMNKKLRDSTSRKSNEESTSGRTLEESSSNKEDKICLKAYREEHNYEVTKLT